MFAVFLSVAMSVAVANAQDCQTGDTKPCGSNIGACQEGSRVCHDGEWSSCIDEIGPQAEVCDNGIDDNCNGLADECISGLGSVGYIMVFAGVALFAFMGILMKMGF